MITGKMTPKPPVTWVATIEMTQAERDVLTLLFYRLKDGMIATGITGHDAEVLNNTFSAIHQIFEDGYTE